MGGLCRLGLGYVGWRAGAVLSEEVRLSHRAEWPHPPNDAEGGRARRVPYRVLHCVPTARTGDGEIAWTDDGSRWRAEAASRNCAGQSGVIQGTACHRRYVARELRDAP